MKVVALAGGTGGAKLAAGLQSVAGSGLTVIANTGDDIEALGVYVSPDPDLCAYWLSGEIDEERGWGIAGDGFTVFERLEQLGAPSWFGLSDLDLAMCLERRRRLDAGEHLTTVHSDLAARLGIAATVLPMCDEQVRTRVRTADGWRGLQEYLIRDHAEPEVEDCEIEGVREAAITPEVESALSGADVIVIGPSNPVISIGPILAVPGMSELLGSAPAPVIAVSPFVAGRVIKGPTDKFMRSIGKPATAAGVAELYSPLIEGMVVDSADPDPPPEGIPTLAIDTLMDSDSKRSEIAASVIDFARTLKP